MSTAVRFTYQDYLQLSEDRRYEIVDGDLYMVPAPVPYHQRVSGNLEFHLRHHVMEHQLGEVYYSPCDLVLSETDVVQPDIFFIATERLSIITETNIQGAPDLVIEILSPATAHRDKGVKQKLYASAGVTEYWIVDPIEHTIEVYALRDNTYERLSFFEQSESLQSPLFPGLIIPLQQVF